MQISRIFTISALAMTAAALPAGEITDHVAPRQGSPCGSRLRPVCCQITTLRCLAYDTSTGCDGITICCAITNLTPVSFA